MALDASIAAALIGAAATLVAAVMTLLFMRRESKNPAPHHVANLQETMLQPHVRDRSHALLDLHDLRETLDELIAEHGGFTDIVYDGRRGELRLSFRWRAWDDRHGQPARQALGAIRRSSSSSSLRPTGPEAVRWNSSFFWEGRPKEAGRS